MSLRMTYVEDLFPPSHKGKLDLTSLKYVVRGLIGEIFQSLRQAYLRTVF